MDYRLSGRAARPADLIRLVDESVDLGGQFDVPLGKSAHVVTGKRQGHLVPADVDVGVVERPLGGDADPHHEPESVGKILEFECAGDGLAC